MADRSRKLATHSAAEGGSRGFVGRVQLLLARFRRTSEPATSSPATAQLQASTAQAEDGEPEWNEHAREDLRQTIRSVIRGELRLAKRDQEDILEQCRESYIQEESPENEWEGLTKFASDELFRTAAELIAEQSAWPAVTDCDRLDRAEAALRKRGILLWQASSCCDTCTGAELPDRIASVEERFPGFRDTLRGYAFFIDQSLPDALADDTALSLYLAYGWFSNDDTEPSQDEYVKNALGIAHQVCDALREQGFKPEWDGEIARKIRLSVNWQRRSMLE